MPELPEVETTRRGLVPHLLGRQIHAVTVRQRQLRWPIDPTLESQLTGQPITALTRRAKYLILSCPTGEVLIHLGMSGSLRILTEARDYSAHDHVELQLDNGHTLRYHDPRRFGCWVWTSSPAVQHPLLAQLGPEPLDSQFSAKHLQQCAKKRRMAVKPFIMDQSVVVGVGNIYASEALFLAGIDPRLAANSISLERFQRLEHSIRQVLAQAITQGGTTLRDFVNSNGEPGYFQQQLYVYGRAGAACRVCASSIEQLRLGQRSSFYCPSCQT